MSKKKKVNDNKDKLVKSINKNVRSSTKKLNPILKGLVGKKIDIALSINSESINGQSPVILIIAEVFSLRIYFGNQLNSYLFP